jgi:hypothetical protein
LAIISLQGEAAVNYSIKLEGFEGQTIEVQPAGTFSGYKLLVNGQPAPQGPKRGQMLLCRDDGTQAIATWKAQLLGFDVPQLVVDGKPIALEEPLKWYEAVWSGWSVLLLFFGGALGAVAGFIAFSVNTKVFRSSLGSMEKYLLTAAISAVAVMAYLVVAALLASALGR